MATDSYVLTQTWRKTAPSKRDVDHWFRLDPDEQEPQETGPPDPKAHQLVKVVICEGDVYVKSSTGETVQRSYADITTCHLCRLHASFPFPDDDPPPKDTCAFCSHRRDTYHRIAEVRVRHCLKMGYQHMFGPFKLSGTAPIPFPLYAAATAEEVAEIVADCQADLKFGRSTVKNLRGNIVSTYARMSRHEKQILLKRFGPNPFKALSRLSDAEDLGEQAGDQTLLLEGESELQDLRVDIEVYRRILAYQRRMGRR